MTLIVGRVEKSMIYMLGDTEVTFDDQKKSNPIVEGYLKQYLINDNLAIGFANRVGPFEQILPKFLKCSNGNDIIEVALEAYSLSQDFDLIIGEIGYEKLRSLKDGEVTESEAGYIGCHDAFVEFQKKYHEIPAKDCLLAEKGHVQLQMLKIPEPVANSEVYQRLYNAFRNTILDSNVDGVGGIVIPLCTHNGKFRYMPYADVTSDLLSIKDFVDEPKQIKFETALGGGYSIEFCDDTPYGGCGKNVGLYCLQGGFGITFLPTDSSFRKATVVKASNPAFWILETQKRLGNAIGSGYINPDHCGIAGESLLEIGEYQDALFCYEIFEDLKKLEEILEGRPAVIDRYIAGYATALFNCGKHHEALLILQTQIRKQSTSMYCLNTYKELKLNC